MCFSTIVKYIHKSLFIQYSLLNNQRYYKHMALLCHLAAKENVQANLYFMTICLACQHFLREEG